MPKQIKKKRRTREHIIADLGTNFIERLALLCGFSVERVEKDYGYDLILFTYDRNGEVENGQVYIQMKATDKIKYLKRSRAISFPLKKSDLKLWLYEPMPVILALYDAARNRAYWLYLQAHFENKKSNAKGAKTLSVHINGTNSIDTESVKLWRKYKLDVLNQLDGVIRHYA